MDIVIVRHADALDAKPGESDAERPLSDEGREKMRKGSVGLKNLLEAEGGLLDAVLASPRRRALETARILAREALPRGEVEICPTLAGGFRWADLVPALEGRPDGSRLALVGHEPDLGLLAGWLVSGDPATAIPLRKGSAIAFRVEGPLADPVVELRWFLSPKGLRLLR